MKIIVCIDDENGMLFNHRRQSRDRILTENVVSLADGHYIYINSYSKTLFSAEYPNIRVSETFLEEAGPEDYCFVENCQITKYEEDISELIIYRWNRRYPADMYIDINFEGMNWELVESKEFKGFSHVKITRERYRKVT